MVHSKSNARCIDNRSLVYPGFTVNIFFVFLSYQVNFSKCFADHKNEANVKTGQY